jgi:hypothetical protein
MPSEVKLIEEKISLIGIYELKLLSFPIKENNKIHTFVRLLVK